MHDFIHQFRQFVHVFVVTLGKLTELHHGLRLCALSFGQAGVHRADFVLVVVVIIFRKLAVFLLGLVVWRAAFRLQNARVFQELAIICWVI